MINLEQEANRPDRYKNRGGKLLLEEKERNKIRNKLPKIEQNLLELVEHYEAETGNSFLICGNRLHDIIEQAWEEHKENKHLLLSAKKQLRENTRMVTPCKSLLTPCRSRVGQSHLQAPATPISIKSATKRKLCTPSISPPRNKIMRNGMKTAPPKILVTATTVRRVSN